MNQHDTNIIESEKIQKTKKAHPIKKKAEIKVEESHIDSKIINQQKIHLLQPVKQETNNNNQILIERPGRLMSEVQLTLNTADAQILFLGSNVNGSVGLLQFGGRMTQIWNAAARDDPYADWYLLLVYDSIIKVRNHIITLTQDYENQLSQTTLSKNLKLQPFSSEKPIIKPLWFRTQYGYLGSSLIADFDLLMRIMLTANRVGVLLSQTHEEVRDQCMNQVIAVFKLPFKWNEMGIKRTDIHQKNELAKKAYQAMGKLPNAILTKKLRAPFSPYINEESELKREVEEKQTQ